MVVAQHVYDADKVLIRQFANYVEASEWVEWLIAQENI